MYFVDFAGNRQFISFGNLAESPKEHLFHIDYSRRQREKIWRNARIVEGYAALIQQLMPPEYRARAEQVVEFHPEFTPWGLSLDGNQLQTAPGKGRSSPRLQDWVHQSQHLAAIQRLCTYLGNRVEHHPHIL